LLFAAADCRHQRVEAVAFRFAGAAITKRNDRTNLLLANDKACAALSDAPCDQDR
jgi:hypothetical protein